MVICFSQVCSKVKRSKILPLNLLDLEIFLVSSVLAKHALSSSVFQQERFQILFQVYLLILTCCKSTYRLFAFKSSYSRHLKTMIYFVLEMIYKWEWERSVGSLHVCCPYAQKVAQLAKKTAAKNQCPHFPNYMDKVGSRSCF